MPTLTGLDRLYTAWPSALNNARVGLLCHPASVNRSLQHAIDIFKNFKKIKLTALFGPQHGIWGNTQDNMIEWQGFRDKKTGLPVYSLYGKYRKPTPAMLKQIDVLVIDLQDVGARYYTFIWTMYLCLEACLELKLPVIILDRPNPINGQTVEGPLLDPAFASFVGLQPLPIRHGMTIGEIARYFQKYFFPQLSLTIILLKNWKRNYFFNQTGLPWVLPSPNLPTLDAALLYPGLCLLEGTNLSEGRGTTKPFQILGAPFIDPDVLVHELNKNSLPGIFLRPLFFQPAFQKYTGKICGGAEIHILKAQSLKPVLTAAAILKTVRKLYPRRFAWRQPPYEYETRQLPIDILAGSDRFREQLHQPLSWLAKDWSRQYLKFEKIRKSCLLYH